MLGRKLEPDFETTIDPELKKYIDFKVLELARYISDYGQLTNKAVTSVTDALGRLEHVTRDATQQLSKAHKHHEGSISFLIKLLLGRIHSKK